VLFLLFHVGVDRFVVEAARVVEVLPLVHWKHVPDAPRGVVGVMNYHRTPVPVVDLSALIFGVASPIRMSTRLVVVTAGDGAGGDGSASRSLLALVAERITGTTRHEEAEFVAPADVVATAPYLGALRPDADGIVQQVDIDHILSPRGRLHALAQSAEVA
jgi:chemotaxis-related protein WspB